MRTVLTRNLIYPICLICFGVLALSPPLPAQVVRTRDQAPPAVSIENVSVNGDTVSGDVVNHSSRNTLRDVQVLIRYVWLWDKETKPGKNDPSRSAYYTLPGEIGPGSRKSFSYTPPSPLGKASEAGHFETSAVIAGFTEVIPGTR